MSLVWLENFGIRHLDRQHRGQALARVVAGQRHLLLLGDAGLVGVLVDDARQRGAEAGQMRAAVALRDVVGEDQHLLVVGVVPPQRHLDADAVLVAAQHDRRVEQRRLGAVDVAHELGEAAVVAHLLALLVGVALVLQDHAHARVEEGQLAQAMLQRGVVELGDVVEGLGARPERDLGAALVAGIADHLERRLGDAVAEAHEVLLAVAPDLELQHGRERVDDGHADAVQAARDLVGVVVLAVAELAAGVQLGHHHLGGGDALLGVDVGRDAAAVVAHGARAVGVERDDDLGGKAGQRLVDGVVDHLVDHVVQARAVVGVADVHAGPLADGVEALEDLDVLGAVVLGASWLLGGLSAHVGGCPWGVFLQLLKIHQTAGRKHVQNAPAETSKKILSVQ